MLESLDLRIGIFWSDSTKEFWLDIKNVLLLCKNLNYSDKSLLAKYFDFITFVADIDEFYQANDEFFSEIKHHKQYHEFYEFLQKNIFNIIDEPILDTIPTPKEIKELNKKKRKLPKNKRKQHPKIKYRRYGTPIEHNFFDEFYQGLYQNCWQDYGYQNDLGNVYICLDDTWYANHNN